jgi:cytochrome P450
MPASPDFDPFSPEAHHDPYPSYRRLRDLAPVHHNRERDIWLISRYDDVQAAARDWATFSSAYGNDIDDTGTLMGTGNLVDHDPPLHDELRDVVRGWYTPKAVASFETTVRSTVRRRLEALLDAPSPADVVGALIWPLHVELALAFLGVAHPPASEWCDVLHRTVTREIGSPRLPDEAVEAAAIVRAMVLDSLRTADPGAGTILAEVAQRCSPESAPGLMALLLIAGVDTPSALLGNALHLLAAHPEERRRLVEEPALISPALEEAMRFESPEQSVARVTTRDVQLHGRTIPRGSRVVLLIASANRDERRFPEPDRFLVARPGKRNVAFGEGIHFCLGAAVARLTARVALEEILRLAPDYRLCGTPVRFAKQSSWGFQELSIDFG